MPNKIEKLIEFIRAWFEWQDAKCWAKDYHPGWVHMAKKARHNVVRQYYKDKILMAYRGEP